MKYLGFGKAIGALAAVVLAIGVSVNSAQAANIFAVENTAPVQLDALTAQNPAEIGAWEYVYDVFMDSESQFDEFQLQGSADWSQIVNQHPFGHGSISGIHTQKWDGYAGSTGIKSWDHTAYGSYNSGGSWTIPGGYTGLGEGVLNSWHTPGDYQGTSSWAGVDPKFVTPGHIVADTNTGLNTAMRYVNSVTTGTNYNGVVLTLRLVHANAPVADSVEFRAYSFNGGGTVYTNTLTGPGTGGGSVPEPSTLAMLGVALLGLCGFIRRRNG